MGRYDGFEEWATARSRALSRRALLLTTDTASAQDLVQDTLIATARVWPRIRHDPDAYVRRVMVTRSVDRWRRRSRHEVLADPPDVGSADDLARDVTSALAVRRALRQLTPRQRAVVVLRFYEDLTEVQAAAELGCSVSTVKSQTRDALARLRAVAPALIADRLPEEVER